MALAHELNIKDQDPNLSDESTGKAFGEIIRTYKPKPNTSWRFGKPNYARVNKAYFQGRTKIHPEGSLESVVSMVVKNWEVDSHHIQNINDWVTMDISKFEASLNGGPTINAQTMADIGPYNMLLGDIDGYKASANTFESANQIFSKAFSEGFAWECIEVYSGPPQVCFKWRHFGKFSGEFKDSDGKVTKGTGAMVEVFGIVIAKVNQDLLIESLKIYYDPRTQIDPLMGKVVPASKGACPFACS